MMPKIAKTEFESRVRRIQALLAERHLDGLLVYGDEYRKENLRYVSNFWPIFERAACFIPQTGEPILACAPEGELYAKEMCVWRDIRNIKEFACVTVPEEIEYPMATFSSLKEIIGDTLKGGLHLGLCGQWDISAPLLERIQGALPGLEIVAANDILVNLRLIKSPMEMACLQEAGRLACLGYEKLIETAVPGNTELMAAGAGEGAARSAGAETISFHVFGSGKRANTIIGRPTNKVIADGDMIMAALAVQYEGYVSTVEFPFVAGKISESQKKFLAVLFEAANVQQQFLKEGVVASDMVKAVRNVFKKHGVSQYDVYPPMHGIGLAEAESPYPDDRADYLLTEGMCVNSDISLFGHPGGSNRIEEGFIITKNGPLSITPFIRKLCEGLR